MSENTVEWAAPARPSLSVAPSENATPAPWCPKAANASPAARQPRCRPQRLGLALAAGLLSASLLLTSCQILDISRSSDASGSPTASSDSRPGSSPAPSGGSSTQPSSASGPAGTATVSGAPGQTSSGTTAPSGTDSVPAGGLSALPPNPLADSYFGPLPKASQVKPLKHHETRAIYLGAAANIDAALSIARTSEVNAVVIDLKESDGVKYASKVPLAVQSGVVRAAYSLPKVLQRFHAENVRVIGRIVCFKDPLLAEARPELTIKDANKSVLHFSLEGGKPFVSPYSQTVWQYNVDLALEAIAMGVDEIQFDYIRFPTGGTTTGAKPWFGLDGTVPDKIQAINRFLQYARIRIQDETGTPLGADVFAAIIISKRDGATIGQDWSQLGLTGIDSLSPMAYPSHYANSSTSHYTGNGVGQKINGILFDKPDLRPYDVMYNTLLTGKPAAGQPGYRSAIRPYLQAFTAGYLPKGYYMTYDAAAIRQQIKAIRDAGYREWICWNPHAQYPADAFDPQN